MKKLLLILSAVVLAGCTVSEIGSDTVDGLSKNVVYTASFEGVDTKVYVDTDLKAHWTADDRISIFTSWWNEEYKFDGQTGDDSGTFSHVSSYHFSGGIPAIYAVYPYVNDTNITSQGELMLFLPSVQKYQKNSYGIGANTMVAVAESNSEFLWFRNLCGYIVVRLYGEGNVKSITLSGNNGEKIADMATVAPVLGQAPAVVMSDRATTSITLDCGEGVELGKTPEDATEFWFVVPPVTFSRGFKLRITNTDLLAVDKVTTIERTVTRNTCNPLSPFEVKYSLSDSILFEDDVFKAYCVNNFDADGDGEVSFAEGLDVTRVSVITDDIKSLVGVELFKNLEYLSCKGSSGTWSSSYGQSSSSGKLQSLDVSNNTKLTYLSCDANQLSALDISNNTSLKEVYCGWNFIKSLDVSNNKMMTLLDCAANLLTSLSLNANTALEKLKCSAQYTLTALDISNNKALNYLIVDDCRVTTLDVSNNRALTVLSCSNNTLSSIDVSNNTELKSFDCSYNQITDLDISRNTELTALKCNHNQLKTLDLKNNAALTSLICYTNQLTSLDVSNNLALERLYCYTNPNLAEIWLKTGQSIANFRYDTDISTVYYK